MRDKAELLASIKKNKSSVDAAQAKLNEEEENKKKQADDLRLRSESAWRDVCVPAIQAICSEINAELGSQAIELIWENPKEISAQSIARSYLIVVLNGERTHSTIIFDLSRSGKLQIFRNTTPGRGNTINSVVEGIDRIQLETHILTFLDEIIAELKPKSASKN